MTGKFPRRGEIYWVNLEPSIGSETKKTRPCLIVSNDEGNCVSGLVIVAPITSRAKKIYPFEAEVFVSGKRGKAMLNQCRALDKSRILRKEDELTSPQMEEVDDAIRVAFGLS